MVLVILGLIHICLCLKWGDWKNWRLYYPTILFYIIVDFNHMLLLTEKELWVIHGFCNDTIADYFISFIIAPCVIILFLSNYPKRIIKQVFYIGVYVFIYSAIDYIAYFYKTIAYHNGWNIKWTIMLYISAFILLRLHYKRPLWAWLVFLILTGVVVFFFKISLKSLS